MSPPARRTRIGRALRPFRRTSANLIAAAVVVGLAAGGGVTAVAGRAPASKPRADLVATGASAKLTGRVITAEVTLRNAGTAGAPSFKAGLAFRPRGSKTYVLIGERSVPSLKARARAKVTLTGPVPPTLEGLVDVQVCADSGRRIKESSESNNCKTAASLDLPPPPGSSPAPAPTPPPSGGADTPLPSGATKPLPETPSPAPADPATPGISDQPPASTPSPVVTSPPPTAAADVTPPETVLDAPAARVRVGAFDVRFSSEPGASFRCALDEGAPTACASPWSTPALIAGSHSIRVTAIDAAGNEDPTPAAATWRSVAARQDLCGELNTDTTLSPDMAEVFVVTCSLQVPAGRRLDLKPGAVVKFAADAQLTAYGEIAAQGTAAEPVTLTSLTDDSIAGDTNGDGDQSRPTNRDWWGINRLGSVDWHQLHVRYAQAIYVSEGSVSIADSTFGAGYLQANSPGNASIRDTQVGGLAVAALEDVTVERNSIIGQGASVGTERGQISVRSNVIENPLSGATGLTVSAEATGTPAPVVQDNRITKSDVALRLRAKWLDPSKLTGNTGATSNHADAMFVSGTLAGDLTLPVTSGLAWVIAESNLVVPPARTLTITRGGVIKAEAPPSYGVAMLQVQGTTQFAGNASARTTFTSCADPAGLPRCDTRHDNSDAGDRDWMGLSVAHTTDWSAIDVRHAYVVTLDGTDVSVANSTFGASYAQFSASDDLSVHDSQLGGIAGDAREDLTVDGNSIGLGASFSTQQGQVTVRDNTIANPRSNDTGLRVTATGAGVPAPVVERNAINHSPIAMRLNARLLDPDTLTGNTGSSTNDADVMFVTGELARDLTLPADGLAWVPYDSLVVRPGVTLSVRRGSVMKFAGDAHSALRVRGALEVVGTGTAHATFTSCGNVTVGPRCEVWPDDGVPWIKDWSGIAVSEGGTAVLDGVDIEYAETCLQAETGAAVVVAGSIQHCETGAYAGDTPIEATGVDWGDPDGPFPIGKGAPVLGNVHAFPWAGYVEPTPAPTPSAPSTLAIDSCDKPFFLGLAGSNERTEPPSMGPTVMALEQAFSKELGGDKQVAAQAIDYPAEVLPLFSDESRTPIGVPLSVFAYLQSIRLGANRLKNDLAAIKEKCKDGRQQVVIAGYSQGALAAHLALSDLAANQDSRLAQVVAVIFIADPGREPTSPLHSLGAAGTKSLGVAQLSPLWPHAPTVTAPLANRTWSLCHANDPVCAFPHRDQYAAGRVGTYQWAADLIKLRAGVHIDEYKSSASELKQLAEISAEQLR